MGPHMIVKAGPGFRRTRSLPCTPTRPKRFSCRCRRVASHQLRGYCNEPFARCHMGCDKDSGGMRWT